MIYTVGIDPGVHEFAYCVVFGDTIKSCGFCLSNRTSISSLIEHKIPKPVITWIEMPDRIDPTVDPKDIISLSFATGLVFGLMPASYLVTPVRWKGQTPKSVTEYRVKKYYKNIEGALKNIPKPKKHHVYDCLGIALYGMNHE